jgi:acetoin utilization protein AcuC
MMAYDFGPGHPLKPVRLARTMALLEHFGWEASDPGKATKDDDVLRVHDPDYVGVVKALSAGKNVHFETSYRAGFASGDNPPFKGMYEASLQYVAGSAEAASQVAFGAPLAFGMAGGLHHARRTQASGFCIFNDCAVAIDILRDRFERVAYIDIDVHHGDGVQWNFYDDPTVLTCSIHQDGRSLYPGTGGAEETGARGSAVNVPLPPGTSADVWIWAFREGILPYVKRFAPEAIVLQMGCDSHATDPLARIENTVQHWLEAVGDVRNLGLPIVALGGGGYDLRNVPRMWAAACMTLAGQNVPDAIPEHFAEEWGIKSFFDPAPAATGVRREEVEATIRTLDRVQAMASS